MKIKSKSKFLALLLILVMAFTACGTKNDSAANPTPEATQQATPEATQEAAPTEDAQENNEVNTIVSFSPSITEIIFALGAQDKLVGRTDYCDYPAEAADIEAIGSFYTPDVEKIVSLKPDVVLASALWKDDVAQKFSEAGIKVQVFEDQATVEGIYTMIEDIAKLVGKEDKAAEVVAQMKTDIKEVSDKVAGLEPKTVYYVTGFGEYGDFTATGDTYIHEMLTIAGGDNIAKDATGWSFSLEKLVESDPEYIIIGSNLYDGFITSENYKNLSAVKNKKVYAIDENLLARQTNRTAEGIRTVAEILHPEAFK